MRDRGTMKTVHGQAWVGATLSALLLLLLVLPGPALAKTKREEAQKLMKVLLESRDAEARRSAAERLGNMKATDAGPSLGKALKDRDAGVRLAVTIALGDIGEAARGQEPALREALKDREPWVRLNAGAVLEGLGVSREEMVDDLRPALEARQLSARVEAAKRLQGLVDDKLLVPIAMEGTESDDLEIKMAASTLLSRLNPQDDAATKRLLDMLGSDSSTARSDAARQLGRIKPPPKSAQAELTRLLRSDEDEYVRSACAGALRSYGAPAVPALLASLQGDKVVDVRRAAGGALRDLGPAAKEAIPALIRIVKEDKEPKAREVAIEALGEMRELARDAIPALNDALKDSDGFVRGAAWRALIRVDPK